MCHIKTPARGLYSRYGLQVEGEMSKRNFPFSYATDSAIKLKIEERDTAN